MIIMSDFIRKKGKLSTSHRYNLLPLLHSYPGGVQRELVVYDFPGCKYSHFYIPYKKKWAVRDSWLPVGATYQARTDDLRVTNALLYRLS